MLTNDYALELHNVTHTGEVEPTTRFQRLMGTRNTGVILKDISMDVRSGEVMAILGSKGSGKQALLDVIAQRGLSRIERGRVTLNGAPLTRKLFQNNCAYLTQQCTLLPGLTVFQSLYYSTYLNIGSKVSRYVKKARVKQVMADLALSQVANRTTETLNISEYRRLQIGVQLVKDPMIFLLDQPSQGLDPLSSYLVISTLYHDALANKRITVLTVDRPRSDLFPFFTQLTFLCLGQLVYSGPTAATLHYFARLGFPCPNADNPLAYYLCLCTVDRRSRERFVESNQQIAALVERFRVDGPTRTSPPPRDTDALRGLRVPLAAFGKPNPFQNIVTLYGRAMTNVFSFRRVGIFNLAIRLLPLPIFFAILWIFYYDMEDFQRTYYTRKGLILNALAGSYATAIIVTAITFPPFRNRYREENADGLYSGPTFLFSYLLFTLPFSIVTCFAAGSILFQLFPSVNDFFTEWMVVSSSILVSYMLAEQQTIAWLLLVNNRLSASVCSLTLSILYLLLGSATLRSFRGLPEWLEYTTYGFQSRYAALVLGQAMFQDKRHFDALPADASSVCAPALSRPGCIYASGHVWLGERFHYDGELPGWIESGAAAGGLLLGHWVITAVLALFTHKVKPASAATHGKPRRTIPSRPATATA